MAWTTPPTFAGGNALAASELNVLGDDLLSLKSVSDGTVFSGTVLYRSAATSIPNDTPTAITWATELIDIGSWYTSGTDAVVPAGAIPAGFTTIACLAIARTSFAANSTGSRRIAVAVNGTWASSVYVPGLNGDPTSVALSDVIFVAAGDVITCELWQNSGGSLNASATKLTLVRLAPVS